METFNEFLQLVEKHDFQPDYKMEEKHAWGIIPPHLCIVLISWGVLVIGGDAFM